MALARGGGGRGWVGCNTLAAPAEVAARCLADPKRRAPRLVVARARGPQRPGALRAARNPGCTLGAASVLQLWPRATQIAASPETTATSSQRPTSMVLGVL